MGGYHWTIDEARENLRMWLDAERAVATGQSYRIGTRSLTRASLSEITKRIAFWRAQIDQMQNGRKAGMRVMRFVPRDL